MRWSSKRGLRLPLRRLPGEKCLDPSFVRADVTLVVPCRPTRTILIMVLLSSFGPSSNGCKSFGWMVVSQSFCAIVSATYTSSTAVGSTASIKSGIFLALLAPSAPKVRMMTTIRTTVSTVFTSTILASRLLLTSTCSVLVLSGIPGAGLTVRRFHQVRASSTPTVA